MTTAIVRLTEPIRRCVRWRTQVFEIEGFLQAFPSFPSPSPSPHFHFLALVSFLARLKPRILFLGLSLLRNQTETLATQGIWTTTTHRLIRVWIGRGGGGGSTCYPGYQSFFLACDEEHVLSEDTSGEATALSKGWRSSPEAFRAGHFWRLKRNRKPRLWHPWYPLVGCRLKFS